VIRPSGLIASALIAAALAGCGSLGSTTAAGAPSSTASSSEPSAMASSGTDCTTRFTSWRDNGGLDDLNAVTADLGTVSKAAGALGQDMEAGFLPPGDEAALQQASASLQSDTSTAQADLPPSCVPGAGRYISVALTAYNRAAVESGQAVTAADGGSYSLAASDLTAAAKAIDTGTGKIGAGRATP
jgi:hypothetical protein